MKIVNSSAPSVVHQVKSEVEWAGFDEERFEPEDISPNREAATAVAGTGFPGALADELWPKQRRGDEIKSVPMLEAIGVAQAG